MPRFAGDEVRSGLVRGRGGGRYVVTAVGTASYAERVAGEARTFRHPRSPLERSLNRLLLVIVGVMVPLGAILGYALFEQREAGQRGGPDGGRGDRELVPEGLILLASLTYAVAALRMAAVAPSPSS